MRIALLFVSMWLAGSVLTGSIVAGADSGQTLAADLVRGHQRQDPQRGAMYERIISLLESGRISPSDALALVELTRSGPIPGSFPAPKPAPVADPLATLAALDGAPAPAPSTAGTLAPTRVPGKERTILQALQPAGQTPGMIALVSDQLGEGETLRIERGGLAVGVAVILRIEGGLAMASIVSSSGAIIAGDRVVPQGR